jgi:acetyl-CoA acetyltransferase
MPDATAALEIGRRTWADLKRGLATMGIAGGTVPAIIIERV